MGTDQHILTEIKHDGGEWQLWHRRPSLRYAGLPAVDHEIDCLSGRDYVWFSILAGVRGIDSGIAEQRGLPKDASPSVCEWAELTRYHSLTWVNIKELKRAAKLYKKDRITEYGRNSCNIYSKGNVFRDEHDLKHDYARYQNLTIEPIVREYNDLCAEAKFLGLKKPEIRLIIGFDS
jgi:hypothetical protein